VLFRLSPSEFECGRLPKSGGAGLLDDIRRGF